MALTGWAAERLAALTSLATTADAAQALEGADLVVLAVPSQSLRGNLEQWRDVLPQGAPLVSLMKGIELGTHLRMSEVIAEVAGVPLAQVAVVSGPNLAKEIAQKQPAAAVVAAPHHGLRAKVAEACAAPYFRPYTNADVVGTEIAGAVKNARQPRRMRSALRSSIQLAPEWVAMRR